ncbi:alkaline phosphatase family protein [Virgibacillus sp. C22-A2]|uniref:Alkaline phosphatase family protein n=1 Tax=Virgibacillus tibetensis TaxID=3042313 RepID=A0ABU6KF46_9BACI|nr:alkaline phosphatase family protein [Virgibacillus sp. C22-A2]
MPSLNPQKKNVILLMIDTLMDVSIQAALEEEKIPALKFFMENGQYYPDLVCPFPTMSVNVDSSLLTGVYCDKHKVPGLVWFNKKENRIINYGSSGTELFKLGIKQSLTDVFYNLNHEHLSKQHQTIHETLKDKGIQTASINALLYRGSKPDQLKIPFLLSFITGLNKEMKTYIPDLFSYGLFHTLNPLKKNTYISKKHGFNDRFSVDELNYLLSQDKLPPFTITYLPDFDQRVHKNGRTDSKGIQKVDKQLQRILNQYESWEEIFEKNIWIILGDNGQAGIEKNRKKALIHLPKLLNSYQIAKLRKGVTSEDDIVLGVNERMSYIYSLNSQKVRLEDIAKIFQQDNRIDVIALKKGKVITVLSGIHEGHLYFHSQGDFSDDYGQSWFIEGNYDILDIEVNNKKISYKNYPDALARLHAAFHSHDGDYVVVSAKPGYEFKAEGSPTHVGGASHGGLHKQDSLVSMIISGTNSAPNHLRTIDLKAWFELLVQ